MLSISTRIPLHKSPLHRGIVLDHHDLRVPGSRKRLVRNNRVGLPPGGHPPAGGMVHGEGCEAPRLRVALLPDCRDCLRSAVRVLPDAHLQKTDFATSGIIPVAIQVQIGRS